MVSHPISRYQSAVIARPSASGTFGLPQFNFATTAGVGDFTSTTVTSMPQASVTTMVVYRGREIRRTFFVPEPHSLAMLVPAVLLLAGLGAVRRRRAG